MRRSVTKLRGVVAGTLGEERGFVLVTVVLAVAVLLVMVLTVSSVASGDSRATPFWRDRDEAFYVAESGLNHCMWKIKYERDEITPREANYPVDPPTFTSTSEDDTLVVVDGATQNVLPAGSSYEVWVKTDPVDTTKAHVTVEGHVNGQSYVLKATLQQENPPFPDTSGNPITPEETNFNMPPDDDPTDNYMHITSSDSPKILDKPVYVIDRLWVEGGGVLIIRQDTTIWVRERIDVQGNAIVNPDGRQTIPADQRLNLVFYMPPTAGLTVTISGGGEFNAFVYAPTARIKIAGNSSVYGALVGDTLKVTGSSYVYSESGETIGFPDNVVANYEAIIWGE